MATTTPLNPLSPLPPVRAAPSSPPFGAPSSPPQQRPLTSGSMMSSTVSIRSWVGTDYWKSSQDYYLLEERSKLHTPVSPFRDWSTQPNVLPAWDSHSSVMGACDSLELFPSPLSPHF